MAVRQGAEIPTADECSVEQRGQQRQLLSAEVGAAVEQVAIVWGGGMRDIHGAPFGLAVSCGGSPCGLAVQLWPPRLFRPPCCDKDPPTLTAMPAKPADDGDRLFPRCSLPQTVGIRAR